MEKGALLIVEDHKNVLKALVQLLEPEFESVFSITNPNLIPGQISENSIDIVLLDMNFSAGLNTGEEGIFWLKKILDHDRDIIVVLLTNRIHPRRDNEAIKSFRPRLHKVIMTSI